jgi:hypothetical protein
MEEKSDSPWSLPSDLRLETAEPPPPIMRPLPLISLDPSHSHATIIVLRTTSVVLSVVGDIGSM